MKKEILKALEEAELNGASASDLKQLKAMLSFGQKRSTKKYPTPEKRAKRQQMQKDSRRKNRNK